MKVKFHSFFVRIGLAALLLCLLPLTAAAQPVPKVEIESLSYDFGSVFEGNDVIHDFVIKNTGDAPLDIEKVRTG